MRGFTLTEILIAMLLFSIGAAAAGRLLAGSQRLHELAGHRGSLNERAQFALSILEPELQMAGYHGPSPLPVRIEPDLPSSALSCGLAFVAPSGPAAAMQDGQYRLPCPPSGGGHQAHTDVLVIRRISARTMAAEAGRLQLAALPSGDSSRLVWNVQTAALPAGQERRDVLVRGYYVARGADGDPSSPALRVKSLTSVAGRPAFVDTEVMPGVEDLQVELGFRGAGGSLRYASTLPDGSSPEAVRLWLLLRSEDPDPALPAPQALSYAGRTITPTGRFHRLLVHRSFGIRNARR
jgi:prepilin-type N-terminal cleavage/methylation domain-containing protein